MSPAAMSWTDTGLFSI